MKATPTGPAMMRPIVVFTREMNLFAVKLPGIAVILVKGKPRIGHSYTPVHGVISLILGAIGLCVSVAITNTMAYMTRDGLIDVEKGSRIWNWTSRHGSRMGGFAGWI